MHPCPITPKLLTSCVPVHSAPSACPTCCDLMDCSPPGSSAHGILQARTLEWVVMPSSRGSSPARDQTHVSWSSCIACGFFTAKSPGKPVDLYTWFQISLFSALAFCLTSMDSLEPGTVSVLCSSLQKYVIFSDFPDFMTGLSWDLWFRKTCKFRKKYQERNPTWKH